MPPTNRARCPCTGTTTILTTTMCTPPITTSGARADHTARPTANTVIRMRAWPSTSTSTPGRGSSRSTPSSTPKMATRSSPCPTLRFFSTGRSEGTWLKLCCPLWRGQCTCVHLLMFLCTYPRVLFVFPCAHVAMFLCENVPACMRAGARASHMGLRENLCVSQR